MKRRHFHYPFNGNHVNDFIDFLKNGNNPAYPKIYENIETEVAVPHTTCG